MLSTKLSEELDEEESIADAEAIMADTETEKTPSMELDIEPEIEMPAEPVADVADVAEEMEPEMEMPAPVEEDTLDVNMTEEDVTEDLELEAIIRELEEDLNEEELTEDELFEDELTEKAHGGGEDAEEAEAEKDLTSEEFIDEIIESILAEDEDGMPTEGRGMPINDADADSSDEHSKEMPTEGRGDKKKKMENIEEELTEAYDTIESLRETINEVNLLNAKLLFTNKLFRNFELSEDQKMKVIENFDRAGTTREVKLVFTTLAENFTVPTKKKKMVKEGAASRPTGTTTAPTKKIINEGNQLANRWKKLAGLLD